MTKEKFGDFFAAAKPHLKFRGIDGSGSGSRVMFVYQDQGIWLYREGEHEDFYLTPNGAIEIWQYRPDGVGEGWVRKFSRAVPFTEIDVGKIAERIKNELEVIRFMLPSYDGMNREKISVVLTRFFS